jgi:hypothetical protein
MLWIQTESSSSSQKMERKSLEFLTDLTFDTNHQQFGNSVDRCYEMLMSFNSSLGSESILRNLITKFKTSHTSKKHG